MSREGRRRLWMRLQAFHTSADGCNFEFSCEHRRPNTGPDLHNS